LSSAAILVSLIVVFGAHTKHKMLVGFGVLSLLAVTSAVPVIVSSCSAGLIRDAVLEPGDDKVVRVNCIGIVTVLATMNLLDGTAFEADRLTLVAGGDFPIFNIQGNASIQGVTFKNGRGTNGGCVTSTSPNRPISPFNVTLSDLTFINCRASGIGGGLFIEKYTDATLTRLRFWECSAGDSGGGLGTATEGHSLSCDDCEFRNNTANGLGGGGMFVRDTAATFSRVTFINNTATGNASGGAVYSLTSAFKCEDCLFLSNTAMAGRAGGVYADGATPTAALETGLISLVNCHFLNNSGIQRGSAVFVCVKTTDQFTMLGGAVCDNRLNQLDSDFVGNGVHVDCTGKVGLDGVSFAGNLPRGENFIANGPTLVFFQCADFDSELSREACDIQQNLTRDESTFAPTPGVLSAASMHTAAATLFLVPLLW
jgi:predicted outer membrane repeat protein